MKRKDDEHDVEFTGKLFRYAGPASWTFVTLPEDLSPPATHAFGRTPVIAWVDIMNGRPASGAQRTAERYWLCLQKSVAPRTMTTA